MSAPVDLSEVARLVRGLTDDELASWDATVRAMPDDQAAALAHDWGLWARRKQLPPAGAWRSWGLLTGRGFGKTRTLGEHVNAEAEAGRARRIAIIAQNLEKTLEVLVHGQSGLIACSPPWFRARFESNRVVWPNGAEAFLYTPEVPGDIRGPEHHLAWASEFVAWPASKRDEAFSNLRLGLRLGYGRLVWDSTPRRRHPLIRMLLERSARAPDRHVVTRGTTYENRDNLTADAVDEWEAEYAGTQRGREELEGEFLDDEDGALWRAAWIAEHRRAMPAQLARRVLSVDPAISMRKGTDATGIVELGTDAGGQVYILRDFSGRHPWEAWGALVVERYRDAQCDCVIVERNRGGDAVPANLRVYAERHKMRVVIVRPDERTHWDPSTLFVVEITARGSKQSRAEPVASLYERGRVSHVGDGLAELEDELTTWEPGPGTESPNRLDALVHGVWLLSGMAVEQKPDAGAGVLGAAAVAAAGAKRAPSLLGRSALTGIGFGGRGRI